MNAKRFFTGRGVRWTAAALAVAATFGVGVCGTGACICLFGSSTDDFTDSYPYANITSRLSRDARTLYLRETYPGDSAAERDESERTAEVCRTALKDSGFFYELRSAEEDEVLASNVEEGETSLLTERGSVGTLNEWYDDYFDLTGDEALDFSGEEAEPYAEEVYTNGGSLYRVSFGEESDTVTYVDPMDDELQEALLESGSLYVLLPDGLLYNVTSLEHWTNEDGLALVEIGYLTGDTLTPTGELTQSVTDIIDSEGLRLAERCYDAENDNLYADESLPDYNDDDAALVRLLNNGDLYAVTASGSFCPVTDLDFSTFPVTVTYQLCENGTAVPTESETVLADGDEEVYLVWGASWEEESTTLGQTFLFWRQCRSLGYGLLAAAIVCGALVLLCTAEFCLTSGLLPESEEGKTPRLNLLHRVPFELVLFLWMMFGSILCAVGASCADLLCTGVFAKLDSGTPAFSLNGQLLALACGLTGAGLAVVTLPVPATICARLRNHCFWSGTLLCRLWRWGRGLCREAFALLKGRPRVTILGTACYLAFCLLDLLILTSCGYVSGGAVLLWLLLHLLAGLLLLFWATGFDRLRHGIRRLAEGEESADISPDRLPPDLKEAAEQLNDLSEGIQLAVQRQLKAERFRTELITNVSHDLKTPLTSIISYIDLLKKTGITDPTALEYLEVLDRKSQRLKKLTEDLVEASKASSGTLRVDPTTLDLSQLVRQALAEYEEKLTAARLTPIVTAPEAPVLVRGDGRHLWRILDNLLSNCAKYALPGTRVYLEVSEGETSALLTVKNISAEPLNLPAEELMERFVRGDASRTTEGSGLGLSIARSLALLQGGRLDLNVDGDLFKVSLTLERAERDTL